VGVGGSGEIIYVPRRYLRTANILLGVGQNFLLNYAEDFLVKGVDATQKP